VDDFGDFPVRKEKISTLIVQGADDLEGRGQARGLQICATALVGSFSIVRSAPWPVRSIKYSSHNQVPIECHALPRLYRRAPS
jgi:hypothetical protein